MRKFEPLYQFRRLKELAYPVPDQNAKVVQFIFSLTELHKAARNGQDQPHSYHEPNLSVFPNPQI